MHTTRLCTVAVFSTTRTLSPSAPAMPSSAIAAVPSASSRALNVGSVHARATTRAPWCGPIRCSRCSTNASIASVLVRPASTSAASSAIARISNSERARRRRRRVVVGVPVVVVVRGRRGRRASRGRLQVVLAQVDVDRRGLGAVAPQVARRERHGVRRRPLVLGAGDGLVTAHRLDDARARRGRSAGSGGGAPGRASA